MTYFIFPERSPILSGRVSARPAAVVRGCCDDGEVNSGGVGFPQLVKDYFYHWFFSVGLSDRALKRWTWCVSVYLGTAMLP